MDTQTKKHIYNHTSQETAYMVDDYPWGFRLRTKIRYWVETKKAKNGGQRFGSQTINPKTGQWCAPKYSTYSPIMIMFLDENNHVKCESIEFHSSQENINQFKETHLENLTDFQKEQLKEIIGFNEVMKHVTFTCKPSAVGPVSLFSNDPEEVSKRERLREEQELRKKEEKETYLKINRAIHFEIGRVIL